MKPVECKGEDWQQQRMRTLVRDDFTCQFRQLNLREIEGGCCDHEPENRLRFLHVHHIIERQFGGQHDLDNLLTLCRAHHIELHPHMRFEYAITDKIIGDGSMKEL